MKNEEQIREKIREENLEWATYVFKGVLFFPVILFILYLGLNFEFIRIGLIFILILVLGKIFVGTNYND